MPFDVKAYFASQMADTGDLQATVSMYIVLGQERTKGLELDSDLVLAWFYGYIDLLQRFQLYNIATCVSNRRRIALAI